MIQNFYKKTYFSIIFFTNLALIFFLVIYNSITLLIISSVFLLASIFFCKNSYIKYSSLYFYITTIFVFYYTLFPNFFNSGIDNFYYNFDLNFKFLVFINIFILCSIFISCLLLFNFFKLEDVTKLKIKYNIFEKINKFIFIFVLTYLFLTILDDYFNTYFLKIQFFGQVLKKIYSCLFLLIPFYVFNLEKFRDKKLIITIILIFSIIVFLRFSRLELMYMIFIIISYFYFKKKYKMLFLVTIFSPILWELFTKIRSGNLSFQHIFDYEIIILNYIGLINNIYGRLSTLTEITTIYYLNQNLDKLSYFEFFKSFLPSFLIGEKIFFNNEWSMMLDLKLIPLVPPYATTAAPGIIAESYLFQNNLFFFHSIFLGFTFFLINKFTYDFPKTLYFAFQLFVFKSLIFKDSLILSGFEYVIIILIIIFLRKFLLKKIEI